MSFVHGDFVQRLEDKHLYSFVIGPGRKSPTGRETLEVYRISVELKGSGNWLVENLRPAWRSPTEDEVAEFVAYMLTR